MTTILTDEELLAAANTPARIRKLTLGNLKPAAKKGAIRDVSDEVAREAFIIADS